MPAPHCQRIRLGALLVCLPCLTAWSQTASASPDLTTPAAQALRQEFATQNEATRATCLAKWAELLQENLKTAEEQLVRKKVAGNISGIAAGKTAVQIFATAQTELTNQGSFDLPQTVRREIRAMVDLCRRRQRAIEASRDSELARLRGEYALKLGALMAEQGTPVIRDEEQRALLTRLEGATAPAAATTPGAEGDTTTAPPEAGTPAHTPAAQLSTSGTADTWQPLGRFKAILNAPEVLSVRILQQAAPLEAAATSPNTQQPFTTRYEPLREWVTADPAVVFRTQSIPGLHPLEVLSWPSALNDWTFEFRSRPVTGIPSRHGVLIEMGGNPETRDVQAGPDAPPTATPGESARIHVNSTPQGATLFLDGKLLGVNRRALKTPCEVRLPPGSRTLQLQKFGYHPLDLDVSAALPGATYTETLRPDPRYVDMTLRVSAATSWENTGIQVAQGSAIRLTAKGIWSCGTKGEKTDAAGYPNNDQFHHYYVSAARGPRQISTANYGALLMRIGADGDPMPVGRLKRLLAPNSGTLYFDINEAPGATHRKDNAGTLDVQVAIAPPQP